MEVGEKLTPDHWIIFIDMVMNHYNVSFLFVYSFLFGVKERSVRRVPAKITKLIRYQRMQDRLKDTQSARYTADLSEQFRDLVHRPEEDADAELEFYEAEDRRLGVNTFDVLPELDEAILDAPAPNGLVYDDEGFPVQEQCELTPEELNGVDMYVNNPINFDTHLQECANFMSNDRVQNTSVSLFF